MKKSIEIFARDDARWDKCFEEVNRAGVVTAHTITVYHPPKDPAEKKIYDRAWNNEKRKRR